MKGYDDIPDYAGFCPDCPQCGATMSYSYSRELFKCPDCGYEMDEIDWHFEDDDDIPWGCQVCGGPYPDCRDSCKLYD